MGAQCWTALGGAMMASPDPTTDGLAVLVERYRLAQGVAAGPCAPVNLPIIMQLQMLGLRVPAGWVVIETEDQALLRKAKAMALSLGITVYIRQDGLIYQHPRRQIIPPPNPHAETAGRGGSLGSEGVSE